MSRFFSIIGSVGAAVLALALQACAVSINHLPVNGAASFSTTSSFSCSGAALSATSFAGGSGTASDPYLICTATQLDLIDQNASNMPMSFKLMADIDLSSFTSNSFHMIGTGIAFSGAFDGNGKTIRNLVYSNATGQHYRGLVRRRDSRERQHYWC